MLCKLLTDGKAYYPQRIRSHTFPCCTLRPRVDNIQISQNPNKRRPVQDKSVRCISEFVISFLLAFCTQPLAGESSLLQCKFSKRILPFRGKFSLREITDFTPQFRRIIRSMFEITNLNRANNENFSVWKVGGPESSLFR